MSNFMAKKYTFSDGQVLFMSDATRKNVESSELINKVGVCGRCAVDLNFRVPGRLARFSERVSDRATGRSI